MFLSKSAVYNSKRSRFFKEQAARRLLNQLGIRTPLAKYHYWVIFCSKYIKMINTIKKWLFAGDAFMPEVHLR